MAAAQTKNDTPIHGSKPKAKSLVANAQESFEEEMKTSSEALLLFLPKFPHPCTLEELDDLARLAVGKEAGYVVNKMKEGLESILKRFESDPDSVENIYSMAILKILQ